MRRLRVSEIAIKQLDAWKKKEPNTHKKIIQMIQEALESPGFGTGKPERLKHMYGAETWSRRINKKDRLIYDVEADTLTVISTVGHYFDK